MALIHYKNTSKSYITLYLISFSIYKATNLLLGESDQELFQGQALQSLS